VQEFYRYPDLLRHSSNFIEHYARAFLAGCIKTVKLFLRGNPSQGGPARIVGRQWFCYGDDRHFSVQGLCQSKPMLDAFFRDIRSVRAQENIGVHLGLPCSSDNFREDDRDFWWSDPRTALPWLRVVIVVIANPKPGRGTEGSEGTGFSLYSLSPWVQSAYAT
jgi:hypothetical protein